MKKMIEFDNIVGGQDGGVDELVAKGNPLHLKVTRHDGGQYGLSVSRINPDGKKYALVHFWLTHAEVQTRLRRIPNGGGDHARQSLELGHSGRAQRDT